MRVDPSTFKVSAAMDETDIMDLTHQKARKRPRPISSADESVHASLKRLPMRAAECRESSLMFAVRGEPLPAASLKQNDHPLNSSPNSVMPAQVNANISSASLRGSGLRWGGSKRALSPAQRRDGRAELLWKLCVFIECAPAARYCPRVPRRRWRCFNSFSVSSLFGFVLLARRLAATHGRPRVFPISTKCLKLLSNFPRRSAP